MVPFRRTLTGLLSLTVVAIAVASPGGRTSRVLAQMTASTVTPAQAAPYLGEWTAAVASQMGPVTYTVSVKVEGGKVIANVAGGMFPPATATEISLSGKNLFLKYSSNFQGMSIPGLIALTPQGSDMLLTISILDGQMEMAGRATKGGVRERGDRRRDAADRRLRAAVRHRRRSRRSRACADLMQMMAALPDSAPATPKQPRTVLVLARAAGFVHASIPLAARTIEALGQKTGAWTTVITYNAADINEREPAAVRRDLPGQHDRDVPRRSGRSGRNRGAAQGAARFRARRQGHRRHSCGHRFVSRRLRPRGAPAPGARAGRRRRHAAVAGVQPADRRVLQVPLALPDADRRQDRRSGEPDQRAVHRR